MDVTIRIKPGVHYGLEDLAEKINGKIIVAKEWSEYDESSEHFVLVQSVDEIIEELKDDFPTSVKDLEDVPSILEKKDHVEVHLCQQRGDSGRCNNYFTIYGLSESERGELKKRLTEVRIKGKLMNWG